METKFLPPHCSSGSKLKKIRGGVIHFISAENVDPKNPFDISSCWKMLHDMNLPKEKRLYYPDIHTDGTENRTWGSYNELIGREEGEDFLLMPYTHEAWHAGISAHKGLGSLNEHMIGVACVANKTSGYTDWQYECLVEVFSAQAVIHGFDKEWIIGHDTARHQAIEAGMRDKKGNIPALKFDPSGKSDGTGSNFDWPRFYRELDDAIGKLRASA